MTRGRPRDRRTGFPCSSCTAGPESTLCGNRGSLGVATTPISSGHVNRLLTVMPEDSLCPTAQGLLSQRPSSPGEEAHQVGDARAGAASAGAQTPLLQGGQCRGEPRPGFLMVSSGPSAPESSVGAPGPKRVCYSPFPIAVQGLECMLKLEKAAQKPKIKAKKP